MCVVDCLDKQRSVCDPKLPHIIDKYVFQANRLDLTLFKIPETGLVELLTVEGLVPLAGFGHLPMQKRLKMRSSRSSL
jgi:hypothetical protein